MEKEELEQQIHETNILVRKLIRMQKYTLWLRIFYVFLVVAILGGSYLYIKPYVPAFVQRLIEKAYETQLSHSSLFQPAKTP